MLFNSYIFWAFFGVVALLYAMLPHKGQNRMLLVASYVFYGYWDWRFLSLIAISTIVDYTSSLAIAATDSAARKRAFCVSSICVNIGLLGFFKYYGFFAGELASLLDAVGLAVRVDSLNIVLPVGISFYTFQTMGYTIDVYRGETKPERNLWDFALYVAFFPQLVAGPIERSSRLLPQIVKPRKRSPEDFSQGLMLVMTGLFKKIVIADNMARLVDVVFLQSSGVPSGLECWLGVYAFAFQIYGDFSGYSNIARGIAKWLGFDLVVNFRQPYLALSMREFWHRWHISLSTWLRDYLYVPLGGSRGGKGATCRNILLTMLLGGLWHGAGWTFLAWGAFHACVLLVERAVGWRLSALTPKAVCTSPGIRILRVVLTFHCICLGWLLFRAESFIQVRQMLVAMFADIRMTAFSQYLLGNMVFFVLPLLLVEIWHELGPGTIQRLASHWFVRGCVYSYLAMMLLLFHPETTEAFIYFRF